MIKMIEYEMKGEYITIKVDGKEIDLTMPMQLDLMEIIKANIDKNCNIRTCGSIPFMPMNLLTVEVLDYPEKKKLAGGIISRSHETKDKYIIDIATKEKIIIHKRKIPDATIKKGSD